MFKFTVYIAESDKPNLLGRDCLSKLHLKWEEVFSINYESQINLYYLLDEFKDILSRELGKMKNQKAKSYLNANSILRFLKQKMIIYIGLSVQIRL